MKTVIFALLASLSMSTNAATTIEINLPSSSIRYSACNVGLNVIGSEDSSYLYASCKGEATIKPFYTYQLGIFYDEIIINGDEYHGCQLSRFVQASDTLIQVDC